MNDFPNEIKMPKWINAWMDTWINMWTNVWMNSWIKCIHDWMNGWMDRSINQSMHEWMPSLNAWTHELMTAWMNRWMGGWMGRWDSEWWMTFWWFEVLRMHIVWACINPSWLMGFPSCPIDHDSYSYPATGYWTATAFDTDISFKKIQGIRLGT